MNYFLRNPRAADSLEGVASWRLLDETIHRRLRDTRRALDWLVAEGYLKAVVSGGSNPIYSLSRERRRDAEQMEFGEGPPVGSPATPEKRG